jgi:predicted RND superfamily exporter protein
MFWDFLANVLLKRRAAFLALILVGTVFMAYQGTKVKFDYAGARLMPETDTVYQEYNVLAEEFGQVSNTIVVAIEDPEFFSESHLEDWVELTGALKKQDGVTSVLSLTEAYGLVIDTLTDKLKPDTLFKAIPRNSEESIALEAKVKSWSFYKDLLYTGDKYNLIIRLDEKNLFKESSVPVIEGIKEVLFGWEEEHGRDLHISGFHWWRIANATTLQNEILRTIFLTFLVTIFIFYLFLKSFRATLISFLLVALGAVYSFGIIGLFGYGLNLLSALTLPLIIVIGVPNSIYLINKYHQEYKKHQDQQLAIKRVIHKVGYIALITNTTTALGFAAFILTKSQHLTEFGIVTSISIMVLFFLSIVFIPVIYSYLSPPKDRHMDHFDVAWLVKFLDFLDFSVENRRRLIYVVSFLAVALAIVGIGKIETAGNVTSDFKKENQIYKDIKYFERTFGGVIPIDIVIDTKEEGGVEKLSNLRRIEQLQDSLATLPNLSRSLSIVDFVKMAKQGIFFGNPDLYELPKRSEMQWLLTYLPRNIQDTTGLSSSMVSKDGQKARISVQMADLTTPQMRDMRKDIEAMVAGIFPDERFDVSISGDAVLYIRSTSYLINNLLTSLAIAVAAIALILALLFMSWRMVLISLVPNLIPMIITAGIMGYAGIDLKPSTLLVFSIAFGISVDDSLHFLAKYKQELLENNWNVTWAVKSSILETGLSMFYTSVVLFCGFSVFLTSSFGGTQALGLLISITLFVAMLSNLLLLPSFLLTFKKWLGKGDLNDTIVDIYDSETQD